MYDVALGINDWTAGPLATKALDLLCDGRGRLERWNFASYRRKRHAAFCRPDRSTKVELAGLLYILSEDVRVSRKLAQIVSGLRPCFMHRIIIAALEIFPDCFNYRMDRVWLFWP